MLRMRLLGKRLVRLHIGGKCLWVIDLDGNFLFGF